MCSQCVGVFGVGEDWCWWCEGCCISAALRFLRALGYVCSDDGIIGGIISLVGCSKRVVQELDEDIL